MSDGELGESVGSWKGLWGFRMRKRKWQKLRADKKL